MLKMNAIDFSKQMAKERDYHRETVRKNNEANEKRLAAKDARNEHVQNKQLQAFVEDKSSLAKDYTASLSKMNEKTKNTINENKDNYHKDLALKRENFIKEKDSKRQEFDQRLSDIKSNYHKAFASEREQHKDVQGNQSKRYNKSIKDNNTNFNEKLEFYQDKIASIGGDLKLQYNQEREQLVRSHEENLKKMQIDSANKRVELKDRLSDDIKKTREVGEANSEQTKNYAADRLVNMQKKYQAGNEAMSSEYAERMQEVTKNQQNDILKANRENQETLLDVQRDFNRQMRAVELDKRRRGNGSGDFAEVMDQQNGLADKLKHEKKVRSIRDELVEAQRTYQERAAIEQSSFNEALKNQNADSAVRIERKLSEVNAEKLSTINHEREKNTKKVDNLTNLGMLEKIAYEQKLMLERKGANERLIKLKEAFSNSMQSLEEKNRLRLGEVAKNANEDKSEFIKRMNENRNQEIFNMKRDFGKLMDSTVENYEKRLATYQKDNEHLKFVMSQKIDVINDQSEKKIESQRKIFEEQRSADIKAQALVKDQREFESRKKMALMTVNFQNKLDKVQVSSETKLKLLTNDYENKLKELRASNSKILAEKDAKQQIEQQRIKQAYEAEKMLVINGYENQITEMKQAHETQINQFKEYNRLS
jgi:hypothetical protein